MPKACVPNIPETRKGAGPCQIAYEVMKRSGKPNWWCRTHGMEASAPDGSALESCPGAWFNAVPVERQHELDANRGFFSVWGALPPAIILGDFAPEDGSVHVHHRPSAGEPKDVDRSFDIVRIRRGNRELVVESMAAVARSISELSDQTVKSLQCPKCGGSHIDERKFATHPHTKHLCNSCGRNFRDRDPSISNPLAAAYEVLGLQRPAGSVRADRPLHIDSSKYLAVAIWPSNSAIVSNVEGPEEEGIHVHAWDFDGAQVVDETYWPVFLNGEELDLASLRVLAVQRSLAHETPIRSMPCSTCGTALISPASGWVEPSTTHLCGKCGTVNKTRRRIFLNPLADK